MAAIEELACRNVPAARSRIGDLAEQAPHEVLAQRIGLPLAADESV